MSSPEGAPKPDEIFEKEGYWKGAIKDKDLAQSMAEQEDVDREHPFWGSKGDYIRGVPEKTSDAILERKVSARTMEALKMPEITIEGGDLPAELKAEAQELLQQTLRQFIWEKIALRSGEDARLEKYKLGAEWHKEHGDSEEKK